jgi:hypothetical protein
MSQRDGLITAIAWTVVTITLAYVAVRCNR